MAGSWPVARDLMSPRPITVSSDAPLSRAIGQMGPTRFHELPVLRRGKLVGMITLESIARRTNLPLTTKVEHLMVLPPLVTEATPYPELAERLLASGLRAAPVVGRRNELVGILSRTDLVRAMPGLSGIAPHRVEEIMGPVSLVLREGDPFDSLFGHLRTLEEHPLPVVDRRQRIVGAVGIADLSRVFFRPRERGKKDATRHDPRRRPVYSVNVGGVMHSPALTVPLGTSAAEAARAMSAAQVSSVFVLEGITPVGIVSQGDLLGLAVAAGVPRSATRPSAADVYVQIHGLRGNGDPETIAEIDRVVAQGLRRISRHVHPLLLSLHLTPHASHRSGSATVQARLHTDRGIFYASDTEWNYFAGIATLMDELSEQVRRSKEESRRRRRHDAAVSPPDEDETRADPDLEERLQAAAAPVPARRRNRR